MQMAASTGYLLHGVTATGEKHVKEVIACFITLIAC